MTPNTVAPRTLVSDESVIGCTLDEVSVVVLGDRLVVVPIAREAAQSSGFELADVPDHELLALGILPRGSVQGSVPLATPVLNVAQPYAPPTATSPVAALQPQFLQPPIAQQPLMQETAIQQPVIQQPVIQPVSQQVPSAVSQQILQPPMPQPSVQQPSVPQPLVQQPLVQQPSVLPPVASQTSIQQPIQQSTQQPIQQTVVEQQQPTAPQQSAVTVDNGGAMQGFSSVPVPVQQASQPAVSSAPERLAPAPAPDFSAWPYVDRRSLMADDDVPTAQNFLNTAIASERRNRNADVAPVAAAPFGDVPRSYDSAASDTRAKTETRPAAVQSTVQIGMASLPVAPEPTVVPSPAAGTGSYDPERANVLPEPIVIPAPRVGAPVGIVADPVPAPSAAVELPSTSGVGSPLVQNEFVTSVEAPVHLDAAATPVDDISESPLARLLASQNLEPNASALEPYPAQSSRSTESDFASSSPEPTAAVSPSVFVAVEPVFDVAPPASALSSGNPFAAPKVGHMASIFDTVKPAVPSVGMESVVGSALWSGEARPAELAPMSTTFGTQAASPSEAVAPLAPASEPEQAPEPTHESAVVIPVAVTPEPEIRTTSPSAPQVPESFLTETNLSDDPTKADSAKTPEAEAVPPTQTRLSPEALQQVYTFDDENPEDLVPLGVSDRLVLRWVANDTEALRVSTVGLSIGWANQKPLVTNLDIDLVAGDMLIIDGPERSGKTALLKTFAGHIAPQHGDVSLDGHSLGSVEGTDFRRREALSLSYVGASSLLVSDLSLVENIELPLLAEGVSPHDARPAALSWLESAGLSANAHLPAGSLSSSDARIATVIRTLICGPALVCVDDVTSGMGVSSARMVLALLEHAQATGAVLLIATNDARLEFDGGYRATIEAGELVPVE
jgi:putative ABC transport system ATP-binding protein